MKLEKSKISNFLKNLKNKRVAVIGDLMLDEYLIGSVSRISPEAPVPVVDIKEESIRFGGAANVCLNLSTLGATTIPFGVIGNDRAGKSFLEMASENNFSTDGIIRSDERMTTVKTRVIGSNQQIVRIDKEIKSPISLEIEQELIQHFKEQLTTIDAVIFEDYNKGVITENIIKKILYLCDQHNIPSFIDPKFSNFFAYKNCSLFKPNLLEASIALSKELTSIEDYSSAARELKQLLKADSILITLSAEGMLLLNETDEIHHIPTKAVEVADVSGAGDTVISTLVAMKISGATSLEAINLANEAAGVVVTEVGIIPITPEQLVNTGI